MSSGTSHWLGLYGIAAISCDSITNIEFGNLLDSELNKMGQKDTLSAQDAIAIAKIDNTIQLFRTTISGLGVANENRFDSVFNTSYLSYTIYKLGLKKTSDNSLYSEMYDLYLGYSSMIRCKDYFVIKP